jgi:hypothetical protein
MRSMPFLEMFRDMLRFLWKKKAWWLVPIVIMLIIIALLIVFAQSSPVSPYIYALF